MSCCCKLKILSVQQRNAREIALVATANCNCLKVHKWTHPAITTHTDYSVPSFSGVSVVIDNKKHESETSLRYAQPANPNFTHEYSV